MAKTYKAKVPFDIGPEDPPTHFDVGDSVPESHEHFKTLLENGYISEAKAVDSMTAEPGLSAKEQAVYEENQGTAPDVVGTQVDVVGEGTPDAEDVAPKRPRRKATARRTVKSTRKK